MKFIYDMYDNQLQVHYKLYQVNARKMSERLFKQYKLSQVRLQVFNSESELARNIVDIRHLKMCGHIIKSDDLRVASVSKAVKEILENTHVRKMTDIGVNMGYEIMPIAISVKDFDIKNPNSKLELIDGFKRMFCTTEVPNINILVKVYDELDDKLWINSMILYNSWKFTSNESCNKYLDRGFQLGLYYRYKIMFIDFVLPNWNIYRTIDIYTTGKDLNAFWSGGGSNLGTYATLWNNNQFSNDIKSIYEILMYNPTFRLKKKGKPEEIYTKPYIRNNMYRIFECFISILGLVRRYEFKNKIADRKPFDINILIDFLQREDLQKQFIKVQSMSVDGFIINYISEHLREEIKKTVFEGLGYSYEIPTKKEIELKKTKFNINDIIL